MKNLTIVLIVLCYSASAQFPATYSNTIQGSSELNLETGWLIAGIGTTFTTNHLTINSNEFQQQSTYDKNVQMTKNFFIGAALTFGGYKLIKVLKNNCTSKRKRKIHRKPVGY